MTDYFVNSTIIEASINSDVKMEGNRVFDTITFKTTAGDITIGIDTMPLCICDEAHVELLKIDDGVETTLDSSGLSKESFGKITSVYMSEEAEHDDQNVSVINIKIINPKWVPNEVTLRGCEVLYKLKAVSNHNGFYSKDFVYTDINTGKLTFDTL